MDTFAELTQRLLEIQSGGRQKGPEIAEHERSADSTQKKTGKPARTVKLSQSSERSPTREDA
jgi:hypothetical protein